MTTGPIPKHASFMQVNRLQPSHIDVQPHGLVQMFDAICVGVTEKGHGAKLNGLNAKTAPHKTAQQASTQAHHLL